MHISKQQLKTINLKTGVSPRTNPRPNPVSQALNRNKPFISLSSSKVVQGEQEKLRFSSKNF